MKNEKLSGMLMLLALIFFTTEITAQERAIDSTSSIVRTMNDKDLQWGPCPEFMPNGCEIAVLHGDPAKRNVDILFKVAAGADIPNHAHTSAERMVLLTGEMEVTYEGERTRKLQEGSYGYGPAQKPHSAKCGDSGPCVLFIAFEEPLDAYAVQK
jgi:quercetin dioxygenase-like cupin family protein